MKTLNMKQIGYQQASFSDSIKSLARQVHETLPNFDEEVSDEVKAELYLGYQLRVAENQPKLKQHFVIESGNYIPVDELAFNKFEGEKYIRSVDNTMSYTPQAFGALRQSNPQLHSVLKESRDAISKYCSNTLNALKKAVREIKNEGKARERGATKSFAETVKDTMDGLKKKCTNAKARVDDTADEKKLILAISEFNRKWLAK
jgi:gas vesicle protein